MSTANENRVRANVIIIEKCYIMLTDIDRQMHVTVGAARSTINKWLSTVIKSWHVNNS